MKITKKDNKDFINKAIKIIKQYEAEQQEGFCRYKINTKYGDINISVWEDSFNIYSIFTRFEDVDLAKQYCSCNPYTGKYNFHDSDKEKCLSGFEKFLVDVGCC